MDALLANPILLRLSYRVLGSCQEAIVCDEPSWIVTSTVLNSMSDLFLQQWLAHEYGLNVNVCRLLAFLPIFINTLDFKLIIHVYVTLHQITFFTRPVVIYILKFTWNNLPTCKIIFYSTMPPHHPQVQALLPRLLLLGRSSLLPEELVYAQLEQGAKICNVRKGA